MTFIRSCTSFNVKFHFIVLLWYLTRCQFGNNLCMVKHSYQFVNEPNVFGKPTNRLHWLLKMNLISAVKLLTWLLILSSTISVNSPLSSSLYFFRYSKNKCFLLLLFCSYLKSFFRIVVYVYNNKIFVIFWLRSKIFYMLIYAMLGSYK